MSRVAPLGFLAAALLAGALPPAVRAEQPFGCTAAPVEQEGRSVGLDPRPQSAPAAPTPLDEDPETGPPSPPPPY